MCGSWYDGIFGDVLQDDSRSGGLERKLGWTD